VIEEIAGIESGEVGQLDTDSRHVAKVAPRAPGLPGDNSCLMTRVKHRGAGAVLNYQAAGDLANDLMPEPAPAPAPNSICARSRKTWAGISKSGVHNDDASLSRRRGVW
jgi:hypothetical protein